MKLMLAILLSSFVWFTPPAQAASLTRVFVIYGMGGVATSAGMLQLSQALKRDKNFVVTNHEWQDLQGVIRAINRQAPSTKIVIIGYSLGASDLPYIANHVGRDIALAVGYDPSVHSSFHGLAFQKANVRRIVLYRNLFPDLFGNDTYHTLHTPIETYNISQPHLTVDLNWDLHNMTIKFIYEAIR